MKVIGAEKVKRRLKHIPSVLELDLRASLFEAAKALKDDVVREIEKPKHGRVYTNRTRGRGAKITWRASAPGEAPAKKTGRRMAQIVAKKSNRKFKPQSRVKAPGIYRLLERGLANIKPRPLFGPLMRKKAPEIQRMMRDVSARAVRKGARR